MKKSLLGIGAVLLAVVAIAQAHAAEPARSSERYRDCLALAARNARAALTMAQSWSKTDGGVPAQHCEALALVTLGRYGEAAAKLDTLARGKGVPDVSLRAALLDQAGNAWMLGADSAKAQASFTAALMLEARDPDLFADLARARAMQKDWGAAETALNEALAISPGRADLLVLRASARDALGLAKEAFADVDRVLLAHPNFADALVERGILKLEAGDKDGARRDWLSALAADPNGDAGRTAREHLDTLGTPAAPLPK